VGRVKGLHVFVGNFTYVTDFVIVEDIRPVIDGCLSQVVFGKPTCVPFRCLIKDEIVQSYRSFGKLSHRSHS
jgi:hypothetical protein